MGILHISESFLVLEQDKYLHNLFAEAAHFVYMFAGIICKFLNEKYTAEAILTFLFRINRAGF